MSGKDDIQADGGTVSAETEAERPGNSGRPAPLSLDNNTPADEDGDGEDAAGGDGRDSAERLTRVELENRYRNDPRFKMLFDDKDQQKKEAVWSVNVGGLRLTPKRILILSGFFLIILFCLGVCLVYAIKDVGRYKDYSRAVALLESGDYDAARTMYLKVIASDPNKEGALAALADIYHHYGDWNNESFFRRRLVRLNPLKDEYYHDFLESAFRARNFGVIYSMLNLKVMDNTELSPDDAALYVISALFTKHESNGKGYFDLKKKDNPRYFQDTERGRFVELLLNSANMTSEQVQGHLATLGDIQDPQVRFETIKMLLYFVSKRGNADSEEEMEKLLREAVELNNFAGAPLLAEYYFSRYRFEDTIDVCEEFLKTKTNAFMPILYGDSCVLCGKSELLVPLADKIRSMRGRQSGIISSYLDSLKAFSDGDYEHLRGLLLETGTSIETPLFSLMWFQAALQADSPKEIRQTLAQIMRGRPFLDFQERARSAAVEYLMNKIDSDILSDPEFLNDCAEIALLIQTPSDDNSFFRRIILLDHSKRNALKEEEIQDALSTFPGDIVLLWIASEFYLKNGQPVRAMDCISEYNAKTDVPGKSSIAILHMQALDQLGRKKEAELEFRAIVEKDDPDGVLLPFYYEFCVENDYVDPLKTLAQRLESLPKDSGKLEALPFVRAEILLADGNKEQALDLFEKSSAADPLFIFHAASRLAEAGRTDAALARYRSIMDIFPDKSLVNIRLSELYAEKGDKDAALACARTAWQEKPDDLQIRYFYGKRLFDAGQYADAVSVLKFPQYRASFPDDMLKLWADAMREQIKSDFNNARYTPVQENLKHLLIYLPEDKFGLEYTRRMEIIRRQSKSLGDER